MFTYIYVANLSQVARTSRSANVQMYLLVKLTQSLTYNYVIIMYATMYKAYHN